MADLDLTSEIRELRSTFGDIRHVVDEPKLILETQISGMTRRARSLSPANFLISRPCSPASRMLIHAWTT
ncbi:MAG: hypothetical protein RJA60_693 [Actinomycetota bacterium]